VPPKFTQDFMNSVLGLKSSSYRAMIPLLKKMGFIDEANVPTQSYKDYREDANSKSVMAEQIRDGYKELFAANEYAYKLTKADLLSKLKTITGASEDDKVLPAVAGTFIELSKLADFGSEPKRPSKQTSVTDHESTASKTPPSPPVVASKLGLSYTINLNLPATTEIEVFNAIFKSLKEHILGEQ
jgi:hypothetical protein